MRLAATEYQGHERIIDFQLFHSRMIRPVRRGQGSRTNGSFPKGARRLSENLPTGYPPLHHRDDTPRERGRPARILSLGLSLSFPAMRHPTALPAGIAWARPKQSHGVVAVRSGSRRWVRLYQDLCGRDARAPGGASSHDRVTPTGQKCRSILAPVVVEGGPSVFWSIGVDSCPFACPFVVPLHERSAVFPRMIRMAGRGPACLRSNTREDCCRRLRGSGELLFPWAYAHG